jgi:hypothetical protein
VKGTWQTTDSGGSGAGAAALVIGAAVMVAAVAGPVLAAVAELARLVVIIVIAAAVLALAATGTVVVYRLRHGQPRALPPRMYGSRSVQDRTQSRALPARPEVHLHFHGVTAEDVAAIIARQRPGERPG